MASPSWFMRLARLLPPLLAGLVIAPSGMSEDGALVGTPFLRTYVPPGINTQYWAIAQDETGVLYFGGNDGVFIYDGSRWELQRTSNRATVRSLGVDRSGRVFVGGTADFGYLDTDSQGLSRFVSLVGDFPEAERPIGEVWKTHVTPHGVFFQTYRRLYRWSESVKTWAPQSAFHFSFLVRDEIWILERGVGLMRLVDDDLRLVPGGEALAGDSLYFVLPISDQEVLVATRERGILRLDSSGAHPFPTEIDEHLKRFPAYHGLELDPEQMAIATTSGVFLLDVQGRELQTLDVASGLLDSRSSYLFRDREGGLWIATGKGVARVDISSPFTRFGEPEGLIGTVIDVEERKDELFVATTHGLFVADFEGQRGDPIFRRVDGVPAITFALEQVGDSLLAATNRGLVEIVGGAGRPITDGTFLALAHSRLRPDVLFAGSLEGLTMVQYSENRWRSIGDLQGVREQVRGIAETETGDLWLATKTGGVLFVDFSAGLSRDAPIRRYSTSSGLPEGGGDVAHIDGKLVVGTEFGLFNYDPATDRFRPEQRFGRKFFDGNHWAAQLRQDAQGRVWMTWGSSQESDAGLDLHVSALEAHSFEPAQRLDGELRRLDRLRIFCLVPGTGDQMWIGVEDGLVRLRASMAKMRPSPPPPLLREVVAGDIRLPVVTHDDEDPADTATTRQSNNSVRFQFALPAFEDEARNEFQYRLEGHEEEWSPWLEEATRDYGNLSPGTYRLQVRGRDVGGRTSPIRDYRFEVLYPWYRTWPAYLGYGVSLVFLVAGADRLRHRHLERRETRLAGLVAERTEALEASEARYRGLVQGATDVIFTADTAGRITSINPAAQELTQYPLQELIGREFASLAAPGHEAAARQVVSTEQPPGANSHEIAVRNRNAEVLTLEVKTRPLRDDSGAALGIEGVARDVTRRKELEERLGHSQKLEALGLLAGGVAHDLNNHLTVILGWSSVLQREQESESDRKKRLSEIEAAATRAQGLTRQLLAFSRKQILSPEVVQLPGLVTGMVPMLHSLLPENVDLTLRLAKGTWRVLVDPGQLEQVVLNLAINAADAMPQGGGLEIAVANDRIGETTAIELGVDPGSYVALSVRDNGCGMTRELRLRIFEPFFSTKEGPKGTGLGLASVHGVVEQSGGHIVVDSEVGEGTTFTIRLPAVTTEMPERVERPVHGQSEPTCEQILVVEDEDQVRHLLTEVLAAEGYRILEASSGEDALRHIEEIGEGIDLLLTDVRMPGIDGIELASRFAQAVPSARILLISGYSEPLALDRDLPDGADFLAKPFTNDTLLRRLRQALRTGPSIQRSR